MTTQTPAQGTDPRLSETALKRLLFVLENCARELRVARQNMPLLPPEEMIRLWEKYGTKSDDQFQTWSEIEARALVAKYNGAAQ